MLMRDKSSAGFEENFNSFKEEFFFGKTLRIENIEKFWKI